MRVKLAKWGNSVGVRLPRTILETAGVREGEEMEVVADQTGVRLWPLRPKKVTLDWIVSEMQRLGPDHEPPTVDWGPDVGSEIIDDDYADGSARG